MVGRSSWSNHIDDGEGSSQQDDTHSDRLAAMQAPDPSPRRKARRATIEALAKTTKYRKPLRDGEFSGLNMFGGDWNEYAMSR
jgi:hypothetical protein